MQKSTKKVLGDDFKNYNYFSYPTDNYGIASCYYLEATAMNFECDTWNCLGVTALPTNSEKLWTLNGFAADGVGPVITLSEKVKREIAVKAVLPEVFQTLGVSVDATGTGIKTVDISFGPGHVRTILPQEFGDYLASLPSTKRLNVFYSSGELVYVFADVVLENFTVSIVVENNLESQLEAKLKELPSGTFGGATLGVKLSKNAKGTYTLTSTKPLVVARWSKKITGPGVLNDSNMDTSYPVMMHLSK